MRVEDISVNLESEAVVVSLGGEVFTIPAASLKARRGTFVCRKAGVVEGGLADAKFDFNRCSFTLSIKKVDLVLPDGAADFGIAFRDFGEIVPGALR
jgi:hypothetical protein